MKTIPSALGAALLLCGATAASAGTLVTFQVDMSTAAFDTNSQSVQVRGGFEGWGTTPFTLTNNPAAANPLLFTGTTNIPLNNTVTDFKYVIMPGASYESSHNRVLALPATSGASVVVPPAYYNDSPPAPTSVDVTFQVDMAQQINTGAFDTNSGTVAVRGGFNGWSSSTSFVNDPTILRTNSHGLVTSNVYVGVVTIVGSPGQTLDYKFYASNYESPAAGTGDPDDNNNRFFQLSSNVTQTLPVVFYNDSIYAPVATNNVTFQVDMTAQILANYFDPASGSVELRGDFNGWGPPTGTQILCTNNPAAPNTNIYSTVVQIVDGVFAQRSYKFWATSSSIIPIPNGGWETMANNRVMQIIAGPPNPTPNVLSPVFFSNTDPNGLLPADTTVTFRVDMNGAVGTDAHPFDPVNDQVYINGIPSFLNWDAGTLAPFQLTNNPVSSSTYSLDILLPKGTPVRQTYKYGINGNDDEAGANINHVRYVRQTGTYVMPLDTFGNMVVEPSFGNLAISHSTAGHVLVSWLGRPGVHLQTESSLSGSWSDHPETDGLSSTNWPVGGTALFFRLINP